MTSIEWANEDDLVQVTLGEANWPDECVENSAKLTEFLPVMEEEFDATALTELTGEGDWSEGAGAQRALGQRFVSRQITATKAMVIHPHVKMSRQAAAAEVSQRTVEARLEEAMGLAEAIDLNVCFNKIIAIQRVQPSTYIGSGSVESLRQMVQSLDITLAVFDTTLSPVQQRNLETQLKCKVIDRTGLILEIFGERAQTSEGRLQVDLAFLKHRRSRLVRAWTHLERQRGGFGFTGGPGESQIELDRRMIDVKIMKLEKELEQVKRTRSLHRKQRNRSEMPIVALVGYTNAGKSTLFNRLTDSSVFAENLLFATLDPTIRPLKLPNGRTVLLSDTVGFISNLPTQLVAAFRATLEEVHQATVILHIRDSAHDDHEEQKKDVLAVLDQLKIDYDTTFTKPHLIDVFNKIDLLPTDLNEATVTSSERHTHVVPVSAMTGQGIDQLLLTLQNALNDNTNTYTLSLPPENGALLAWCYRHGVIESRMDTDEECLLRLHLNEGQYNYILAQIPLSTSFVQSI